MMKKTKPASPKSGLAPPKPSGRMGRPQAVEPESPPSGHRASGSTGGKAKDPGASTMGGDYANLLESIRGIASSLQAINQMAVTEYTPVLEAILRSPIPDARWIERTLDGLLDFCGYEPALRLYKKLCRYYFDIDPAATVEYINAYRELWDSGREAKP
jgi:hypothetical protein